MPKKRKQNVAREVKASGNRSQVFAQGQRRVSTPRGRSSALTLYAEQTGQQLAGAQRREAMDSYYEQRAQESQAQEELKKQVQAQVRATALAESQAREQARQGARAQVRSIRDRQAQRKATDQQALSDRLGRARARADSVLDRRQGLLLARQQHEIQLRTTQAQLYQQRQQHNEGLAQQRQIQSRKAEAKEQVAEQQFALQREGMSRQDRLIDSHFTQMRGMFAEAQHNQERRLGEIEGKMNEGLAQLQNQRQQKVDITYLNRASGRTLDRGLLPDNTGLNRPQLQLQRADTTDSEASQLADEILGRGTTSDRRQQDRSRTTTPMFNQARENLAKTLTAGDFSSIAENYNSELKQRERQDKRDKAIALARRRDLIQDGPSPQELDRRRQFLNEDEPLSLVPQRSNASTIPYEDSDEDDLEIVPLNVSQTNINPTTLSNNISAGVGQAGQLVGEGISGGLRKGAGVVGGIATGLGEAVYNQLPQPRDVGIALGEGAIAGGKGALAGLGAVAQAGAGAVADYLEPEPEPEDVSTPSALLENVNPIQNESGRFTSGNDRDGWKPTQYKVTDMTGSVGKRIKGKVYYVMTKNSRNVAIVDITNPKLTKWNNVGIARFDKLIKEGKISM